METTELLAGFEAWAATKDPTETYDYMDNDNCAFAQYLKAIGRTEVSVLGGSFSTAEDGSRRFPQRMEFALQARSFGGVLAELQTPRF